MRGYYLFAQAEVNRFRPVAYCTELEKIRWLKERKEEENPHVDFLLLMEVEA